MIGSAGIDAWLTLRLMLRMTFCRHRDQTVDLVTDVGVWVSCDRCGRMALIKRP